MSVCSQGPAGRPGAVRHRLALGSVPIPPFPALSPAPGTQYPSGHPTSPSWCFLPCEAPESPGKMLCTPQRGSVLRWLPQQDSWPAPPADRRCHCSSEDGVPQGKPLVRSQREGAPGQGPGASALNWTKPGHSAKRHGHKRRLGKPEALGTQGPRAPAAGPGASLRSPHPCQGGQCSPAQLRRVGTLSRGTWVYSHRLAGLGLPGFCLLQRWRLLLPRKGPERHHLCAAVPQPL